MAKYYREVPVTERLPIQDEHVTWVMDNGHTYYGYMDEECGNWWAYIYDDNGDTETMSPHDFIHWIEPVDLKELIVSEVEKSWDAAENFVDWSREKMGWSKDQPNKEEYINQLKESI